MQIIINGQRRETAPASLAELWQAEARDSAVEENVTIEPRGYAIAVNGAVVRRDAWARTPVNEGDRIEIVRAVQGG